MQFASHKFIVALSLFVLLAFVPQILNAQKGEFGVRFMPTISSLDVQSSSGGQISGDATVGFGAGIFLGFNFSDNFGLQGEAIYSTLNQKYTEDDVEKEIKLEYINIPLLLSFNTGKLKPVNFNVVAGPQIGISAVSYTHLDVYKRQMHGEAPDPVGADIHSVICIGESIRTPPLDNVHGVCPDLKYQGPWCVEQAFEYQLAVILYFFHVL